MPVSVSGLPLGLLYSALDPVLLDLAVNSHASSARSADGGILLPGWSIPKTFSGWSLSIGAMPSAFRGCSRAGCFCLFGLQSTVGVATPVH